MESRNKHICPVEHAGSLDSTIRRWLQNPQKILKPHIREGMTALEIGCGPGFFTLAMAEMLGEKGRVIAVDLQDGMLDKVRAKIAGTELEQRIVLHKCMENSLGLSETVDFILLFYVVHEVPDPRRFFRELSSLLKQGKTALFVEPPFHVSKSAFAESLLYAEDAGLIPSEGPGMLFHQTAILTKQ